MTEKHPNTIASIGATGARSGENITLHLAVTQTDGTEIDKYWRENINIEETNDKHRNKSIETVEPFEYMWDGTLGQVPIAIASNLNLGPNHRTNTHLNPRRPNDNLRREKLIG